MAAYPNENKIVYGIVVGGNENDPDPTQSGGCRIYIPGQYGAGVDVKHLPFSRSLAQGNQQGVTTFNPPPEHGSAVMCMKMPGQSGSGHLTILGAVPNDINKDATTSGGSGSSSGLWPAFDKAIKDKTTIRIPPNIGSGPAGSKPPKEKGEYHSNELMKNLPSTGTLWPLNGIQIPQVTGVSSATQSFTSILTGNILSQLPGMSMSLGSLFSSMPATLLNGLLSSIPPEISGAMQSMSALMQSMEMNEAGGFTTAARINPDVFFSNAVNLLSNARSVYDVVGTFQRLQSDTTLYGLDSLPPVSISIPGGPFGDISISVDATGAISSLIPDEVQKVAGAFSSLMSNGAQFPGVFPGANMFGGSAGTLNEMFNRLPTSELKTAVTQMKMSVAAGGDPRAKLNEFAKKTMTSIPLSIKIL